MLRWKWLWERWKPKADVSKNFDNHRKPHEYSSRLAIEYGKDYEKKVAMSGEYSFEEHGQTRNFTRNIS